ncbi:MAG: hypothetical protein HQ557_00010 [Bacteroidetes bacterium]|nr:hypothetical protein [Bacteroidota bacterium]
MLPSDHFVRMYNEVFKMIDEQPGDALKQYWLELSSQFELDLYIEKDGFQGMFSYWEHIRVEENCDMTIQVTEDYFELRMHKCPSLSKNLDNDAGLYPRYCEHCAVWIHPIMRKHNYWSVYNIISATTPKCHFRIYKDKKKAIEFSLSVEHFYDPYQDLQGTSKK